MSTVLTIDTGKDTYPIVIEEGLVSQMAEALEPYIDGHQALIVTDTNVSRHYVTPVVEALDRLGKQYQVFTLPAGEATKSFVQFERLCEEMLATQLDRQTTVIALGGGVIGDITGFAASVLLRGVPYIQIPTTLLAQVDSSVGGKTAINTSAGKNLVGSFYQPNAVLIDVATLTTLPRRELLAGYAEVLKYGLLGDRKFYEQLLREGENALSGDTERLRAIIRHCCSMKAAIVSEDEKEKGQRALLNLGHTFGHAIEKMAGYDGRVLHGEAVAIGCLMAMSLSRHYGKVTPDEIERLKRHYHEVGLPVCLKDLDAAQAWDAATLTGYCYQDKKASGGKTTFIVLDAIGQARIERNVMDDHIEMIFEEYR